jgi:putative spermidine/putrescine transport system substrate-binding protein
MSNGEAPLRVMGAPGSMTEAIRKRAEADLGFPLHFQPFDGLQLQRRAVVNPDGFDVLGHWSLSTELAWTARAIQPIDVNKIDCWEDVLKLDDTHQLLTELNVGKGVSPRTVLFVQANGLLGPTLTEQVAMVPTMYHFDSFGYHPSIRSDLANGEKESWGWLLDDRWRGRVALTSHPPIGIVEMALAAEAKGLMQFNDVGNLEIEEIDELISLLIEYRHKRHFRAFWENASQSVELMRRGGVRIESMWPEAIQAMKRVGIPVCHAVPREGTRAWMIGLSVSSRCKGVRLKRAYSFINWWLSGWVGAYIARLGIYSTASNRAANYLTEAEWAYWYRGEPATTVIRDNSGRKVARPGEARSGGSYVERMKQVAVWNTFNNEYNYLIRRWRDFMTA